MTKETLNYKYAYLCSHCNTTSYSETKFPVLRDLNREACQKKLDEQAEARYEQESKRHIEEVAKAEEEYQEKVKNRSLLAKLLGVYPQNTALLISMSYMPSISNLRVEKFITGRRYNYIKCPACERNNYL